MKPPGLAREFLRRALPPSQRDLVVGDLDEEFLHHVAPAIGFAAARRWYWRQALFSIPSALRLRTRVQRRTVRPRRPGPGSVLAQTAQDVRYAARVAGRQPGVTASIVLTHALGIAVSTAVATVAYAVLVRPLPYADADRLVHLFEGDPRRPTHQTRALSHPDFIGLRRTTRAFELVAGYSGGSRTLTSDGVPERVTMAEVSDGFFELLGVRPLLGRTFTTAEASPGGPPAVILSHGSWQRRFGADAEIVGRTIVLNGTTHPVVGVLPPEFEFPLRGLAEFWLPLVVSQAQAERGYWHWLDVIGRLAPGVTHAQARDELVGYARRLGSDDPKWHSSTAVDFVPLRDRIVGGFRGPLVILLAAVSLMLAAACASVASVLVARWAARTHEMGVRAAIGAHPLRIVRQLITESLLLAALGGAIGLAGGHWLVRLFAASVPPQQLTRLPHMATLTLDPAVVMLGVILSVLTGLLFGVLPALSAVGPDPARSLRGVWLASTPRVHGGARTVLVAAEVAVAVVLLTGATLLGRSLHRLLDVSPGFDTANLLTLRVNLPGRIDGDAAAVRQFHDLFLDRLGDLPGASGAASISQLPLTGRGNTGIYALEGDPAPAGDPRRTVAIRTISANYFEVMGIPPLAGRGFTLRDTADSPPVVLINQTLAVRLAGGADPIGRRISFEFFDGRPRWEVVGVVGDEQFDALDRDYLPVVYFPFAQATGGAFSVVLRTAMSTFGSGPAVRAAAAEIDPSLPVFEVRTMEEIVAGSEAVFVRRQVLSLLALFAIAALTVSAIGLYGVLAQSVTRQRKEIGVRIALGAGRPDVIRLILVRGMKPAMAGIAAGASAALLATRALRTLLFEISPADPLSLGVVTVTLMSVALISCLVPARRATRVDPVAALRGE
ncbi:MAG TPA: ADOP family duplicated permease [Vicinamibacterales bacterium]|nr:ADOP family duplicated permease [Vicinamibacterales bacterium]